jgi:hypothetical protein
VDFIFVGATEPARHFAASSGCNKKYSRLAMFQHDHSPTRAIVVDERKHAQGL